ALIEELIEDGAASVTARVTILVHRVVVQPTEEGTNHALIERKPTLAIGSQHVGIQAGDLAEMPLQLVLVVQHEEGPAVGQEACDAFSLVPRQNGQAGQLERVLLARIW